MLSLSNLPIEQPKENPIDPIDNLKEKNADNPVDPIVIIENGIIVHEGDFPKGSTIKISYGSVKITGNVGDDVTIETEDRITIEGNIGINCKIRSTKSSVFANNIGDGCNIIARCGLRVGDTENDTTGNIGNNVSITALNGRVFANKLEENVTINSEFDIEIKHPVPDSTTISRPRNGRILINNKAFYGAISPGFQARALEEQMNQQDLLSKFQHIGLGITTSAAPGLKAVLNLTTVQAGPGGSLIVKSESVLPEQKDETQ